EALCARSHDPFRPLGLLVHTQLIFYYFLHHAVDAVGLAIDIEPDERVAWQWFKRFVEHEWILGTGKRSGKYRAELRSSAAQQLQRDSLWTQEGAYTQHIGCDRVLLDFLEVELPGAGHRRGVVACLWL